MIKRRILAALLIGLLVLAMMPGQIVRADEEIAEDLTELPMAENISGKKLVTDSTGFGSLDYLFDGATNQTGKTNADSASLTLEYAQGMGSLYFVFWRDYGAYTVTDNDTGASTTCGEKRYLHEFIDLVELFGHAPTSVTVRFENGKASICELSVYTEGQVPSSVQRWEEAPEGGVDLILFSTHGDDEQLFFAGLLPYYAGEMDYEVLVVYLTDHKNYSGYTRMHEMLNGLWSVGVTNYPVFGEFMDYYAEDAQSVYKEFEKNGYGRSEVVEYIIKQLRYYHPQVVVGHDFAGEYGHGQHMVYAECLAEALECSNDPDSYPELAAQYGLWDVPKAYFHLYEENPVVMDWDQPLEALAA